MKTLRQFAAAVQFMTRIPMPAFRYEPDLVLGGAKFYPIVGALVALGAIGIVELLRGHLPVAVTALIVLAYLVIITGGFHEDGLADTADALGGGWTRERMLEIMHDSRIGSFGTLAICLSLLARWSLLAAMPIARLALVSAGGKCLVPLDDVAVGRVHGFGAQRWPGSTIRAQDPNDLRAHRNPAGIRDCRLGAAHARDCPHRCGQPDHLAERTVLPFASRRRYRRLFRRDQSTGRNCGLPVRGVAMTRATPSDTSRCTLILIRHGHTHLAGTFCGLIDPPLSKQGMRTAAGTERETEGLSDYADFQQRPAACSPDGGGNCPAAWTANSF